MSDTRCPVEGCDHIGGIWQGWSLNLKSTGVWVCADHYPLSDALMALLVGEEGEEA